VPPRWPRLTDPGRFPPCAARGPSPAARVRDRRRRFPAGGRSSCEAPPPLPAVVVERWSPPSAGIPPRAGARRLGFSRRPTLPTLPLLLPFPSAPFRRRGMESTKRMRAAMVRALASAPSTTHQPRIHSPSISSCLKFDLISLATCCGLGCFDSGLGTCYFESRVPGRGFGWVRGIAPSFDFYSSCLVRLFPLPTCYLRSDAGAPRFSLHRILLIYSKPPKSILIQ
jgi:hypothetical protein